LTRAFLEVRGIVFDLDGTLIDSYAAITESLNRAMIAAGLDPLSEERVRGMVGLGLETLVTRAMGAARVEEGVRRFREHYDRICVARTSLLPQVAETVPELDSRGYRLAVATNKPSYFARRLLDGLGIGEHFAAVLGPDNVVNRKPHPEMVLRALEEMGLSVGEAVYVGDMEVDIQTARAGGLPVVVLPTGSREAEVLRAHDPDLFLEEFRDLLTVLPGAPGSRAPTEERG
jgi:phosphoglycolate phosphatase